MTTKRRNGRSLTAEQQDTLAHTLGDPLVQALDAHHKAAALVSEELLGRVQSTASVMVAGPYAQLEARLTALEAQVATFMQARAGDA